MVWRVVNQPRCGEGGLNKPCQRLLERMGQVVIRTPRYRPPFHDPIFHPTISSVILFYSKIRNVTEAQDGINPDADRPSCTLLGSMGNSGPSPFSPTENGKSNFTQHWDQIEAGGQLDSKHLAQLTQWCRLQSHEVGRLRP